MSRILDDLYYGKIRPWERANINDEKYNKLAQEYLILSDKLNSQNIDKDLFEQFLKVNDEMTEYLRKEAYVDGVEFGVRLISYIFCCER